MNNLNNASYIIIQSHILCKFFAVVLHRLLICYSTTVHIFSIKPYHFLYLM